MHDVHCHVDLYPNPLSVAKECEQKGIYTIGMTNLPSHFNVGYQNLLHFKKVRLALGMHPLYANRHSQELQLFNTLIDKTSYIGEIGLDFSKEGLPTKTIQLNTFEYILDKLQGKKKILSLHSRDAENEVLQLLKKYKIGSAIFHWYTGPLNLIAKICSEGYFFSINPAMIVSQRGQAIIDKIPPEHLLTESDGPFIDIKGRPIKSSDIKAVIEYLAKKWNKPYDQTQQILDYNFRMLLSHLTQYPD